MRERLIEFLAYLGMGQNRFEEKVGLSIGYINKLKGDMKLGSISKVVSSYPELNQDWLIRGEGSMLKETPNYGKSNAVIKQYSDKVMRVPLISQYAYAGYVAGYNDPEYLEHQPQIIVNEEYTKGVYIAIEVRGDSMDDGDVRTAICEGDIVVARELYREHWKSKFRKNEVYIIVHREDGIIIKEIKHHDVERGIITVHSRNSFYKDYDMRLDEVVKIFYVKELRRRM